MGRNLTYITDEKGNAKVAGSDAEANAWWKRPFDQTRRVAKTNVGEVEVSTVFLAIDHALMLSGPPVLWETMVFGGDLDGEQERYTSREDALAGHEAMVARVKQATP